MAPKKKVQNMRSKVLRMQKQEAESGYDRAGLPQSNLDSFLAGRHKVGLEAEDHVDDLEDIYTRNQKVVGLDMPDPDAYDAELDDEYDANNRALEDPDALLEEIKQARDLKPRKLVNTEDWGTEKEGYYGDDSDQDLNEEEEDEVVLAEQKKRLAGFNPDRDFDVLLSNDADKTGQADEEEGAEAGLDDDEVENIEKNLGTMNAEQKLELIEKQSPELLQLLDEFKTYIQELKDHVSPLLQQVKEQKLQTSSGVSYLDVKFHLLMSYCTNVCFYMMMKSEGKSVKDHPVISHLLRLRTYLEKLKPLDNKLQYQIDKIIRQTNVAKDDPTQFRAGALIAPNSSSAEFADEDDDIDTSATKGKGKRPAAIEKYIAPKLSSVKFDDDAPSKSSKEERAVQRAQKSKMMDFIRGEYSDAPESIRGTEHSGHAPSEKEDEIERWELEHMTRLNLPKSQLAKQRKKDEFSNFEDFKDISRVYSDKKSEGIEKERAKQAHLQLARIAQSKHADANKGRKRSADDDNFIANKRNKFQEDREQREFGGGRGGGFGGRGRGGFGGGRGGGGRGGRGRGGRGRGKSPFGGSNSQPRFRVK